MTNLDIRVLELKRYFKSEFGNKKVEMKYREFTWHKQRIEFLLGKLENCPQNECETEIGTKYPNMELEAKCDDCANQYLNIYANGVEIYTFLDKEGDIVESESPRDTLPLEAYFGGDNSDEEDLYLTYLVCLIGYLNYDEMIPTRESHDAAGKLVRGARLGDGYYRFNDIWVTPEYRLHRTDNAHLDDFDKRK